MTIANDPKALDRFWSKVEKTDYCWIWRGTINGDGYGELGYKRRMLKAHRLSHEIAYGPIPDGLEVCHECDNPPCVRPDHLFLGTHLENMQDSVRKGRMHRGERNGAYTHPERVLRGEKVGNAKLTEQAVRDIRRRYAAGGVSYNKLAREHAVDPTTIRQVVLRETWRHVADEHELRYQWGRTDALLEALNAVEGGS